MRCTIFGKRTNDSTMLSMIGPLYFCPPMYARKNQAKHIRNMITYGPRYRNRHIDRYYDRLPIQNTVANGARYRNGYIYDPPGTLDYTGPRAGSL